MGAKLKGMISTIEFLVLMEPSTTCLTCKTKKSNDDRKVLHTRVVLAKRILIVKLARSM